MVRPRVITEPAYEPISLAELKSQCKIDTDDQDTELALFISAARGCFEDWTNRTLYETEYEHVIDYWPCGRIYLPRATPLIEVSDINYLSGDGTENTWTDFVADTRNEPGSVAAAQSASFPGSDLYPVAPIRITYRAGMVTSPLPSPWREIRPQWKLAILMLAAGMNENREAEVLTDRAALVMQKNTYVQRILADATVHHRRRC